MVRNTIKPTSQFRTYTVISILPMVKHNPFPSILYGSSITSTQGSILFFLPPYGEPRVLFLERPGPRSPFLGDPDPIFGGTGSPFWGTWVPFLRTHVLFFGDPGPQFFGALFGGPRSRDGHVLYLSMRIDSHIFPHQCASNSKKISIFLHLHGHPYRVLFLRTHVICLGDPGPVFGGPRSPLWRT